MSGAGLLPTPKIVMGRHFGRTVSAGGTYHALRRVCQWRPCAPERMGRLLTSPFVTAQPCENAPFMPLFSPAPFIFFTRGGPRFNLPVQTLH